MTIEEDLIKEFGNIIHDANSIIDNPPPVISVGPKVDIALGGGVPEGSLFILTGPEKCGKTLTALTFGANAQQRSKNQEYDRKIYFANVEGRIKARDLQGINGLLTDQDHFVPIGSSMGSIMTGEQYLMALEKVIKTIPYSVCILDSFSSLASESELTSELTDHQVMAIQKTVSKFVRRVCNVLPVNRTTLVGITHLMANVAKFGRAKAKIEKSAGALKYGADVKLYATHTEAIMQGDTQVGQTVHWKVEFSAIGPPGQKVSSHLKYGRGIWKEYEIIELAKDFGIVEGSSWMTIPGVDKKVQGMNNAAALLEEEPNLYYDLKSQVYEMVGLADESERFVQQSDDAEADGSSDKAK